jgi:hypothetical protein
MAITFVVVREGQHHRKGSGIEGRQSALQLIQRNVAGVPLLIVRACDLPSQPPLSQPPPWPQPALSLGCA